MPATNAKASAMCFRNLLAVIILSISLLASCTSGPGPAPQDPNNPPAPTPTVGRLSYGDTLFFLGTNAFRFPVSKPSPSGYFKAIPFGLSIDTLTGRINIAQSETGIRYKIYYVSLAGEKLDSVKIVISGIDYRDTIVQLAATPSAYDTSFPIYNARPGLILPCGDDDEDGDGDLDDDDNRCVFDETDLDNDGDDDIDGVNQEKLLVDIKKGFIDVEASFQAGIFGSSNPANGLMRDFTFYYRIDDASNRALNKISVRVYHYRRRADIPQALFDTLNLRNDIAAAVNSRVYPISGQHPQVDTDGSYQSSSIFGRLEYASRPKRPPIIIIVSQ